MSESEPVTRREYDEYKAFQRELREAALREVTRIDHRVGSVETAAVASVEALRQNTEQRFTAAALQREQDLKAQQKQREEDQDEAQRAAEHRKEWSWQMKLAVIGLAVAIAGLYLQHITAK